MTHMLILFNLHYDSTYSDRYNALNDAIKAAASGDVWKETTSSCVILTSLSATTLDVRLCATASLDPAKDKLVVIDIDKREKSTTGIKDSYLLTKNLGF